jgi:hypothetical protein
MTFSDVTGFVYCFAQVVPGTYPMVRGFAGVPSNVTRPAMAPPSGLAEVIISTVNIAADADEQISFEDDFRVCDHS